MLDIDVNELAGMTALISVGRLDGIQARAPARSKIAHTVEAGIAVHCAISAAVIRNRRSDTTACTRSSPVRYGIDRGAEPRSITPARPSRR
jgi:hypothetical protein